MLRLGSSKIHLEKKDLDYHRDTHRRRQNARLHGHRVVAPTPALKQTHKRNKSSKSSTSRSLRKKLSSSPVKLLVSEQNHEDSLISRDPVPRGSRAFWDKVLAEAGTPTRTKTTGSGNGRIFDPSDGWIETSRSTRASIEEVVDPKSDTESDGSSINHRHVLAPTTHSPSSSSSSQPTCTIDSYPDNISKNSMESIQQPSSRNRFSNFFRWKSKLLNNTNGTLLNDSTDVGLDGHNSDLRQSHDREKSNSAVTSHDSLLGDGLYGSRRDRGTISASLDKSAVDEDIETPNPPSKGSLSTRPSPPDVNLPVLTESLQRPSGTIARSPLYISQAAASSSPEKSHDRPCREPSIPMVISPSLLSLPPRRRRTYRPRSETYSFEHSEASSSDAAKIPTQVASPAESNRLLALNPLSSPLLASISNGSPLSPSSIVYADHHQPSTRLLNTPPSTTLLPRSISRFSSRSSSCLELPGNPFNLSHSGRTSTSSSHIQYPPPAPRSSPRALSELEIYQTAGHATNASNATSPSSSYRNLSPHALPFIPRKAHARNLTPQYPLPPPFGATARTVSYSRTMPDSTSFSTPLSTPPVSPQTPPPRQRSAMGLNPTTPSRGTFSIYNDSQPPNTQPQTPADITRRLPLNPFNTATAYSRSSFLPPLAVDRAVADWQTFASPTRGRETPTRPWGGASPRRMEAMVTPGGENADAVTSVERERRREWNIRVRMGGEEQGRLQRSPGLARGPGV